MTGSAAWCASAASIDARRCEQRGRRPRVHRPAGARAQADRRARRRAGRDRLAGEGEEHRRRRRRSATIRSARGSATCRSCTSPLLGMLDAVGLDGAGRAVRGVGALQAVERLNLDGLLALWHPPVKQLMPDAMFAGCGKGAGRDDQVRTGAAHLDVQSASLSARRREHRQRHPRRDRRRDVARRPGRAARLRRVLGEEPAGPHRAQSAHRRACLGRRRSRCRSSRPARKCASG